MKRREFNLQNYRRLTRLLMLAAVGLTTWGLYAGLHHEWHWTALGIGGGVLSLYLAQRIHIKTDPLAQHLLVFVTKSDCALCEEARLLLPKITEGTPFRVEEESIDENKFLRRHFRDTVPVLLWQGEEIARLRWDADALRARLQSLAADPGVAKGPSGQQSP